MSDLQKIIKVTPRQYEILANGGTVGGYTGFNSNYLYLVENNDTFATEDYVDNAIADLVNSAPEALDTLGELATALEEHENAYDALLETVGGKADKSSLATVATSGSYNDLSSKPSIPNSYSKNESDNKYALKTELPTFSYNSTNKTLTIS